ncbi:HAD family phosphatase [Paenibacillus sp. PR3]|uniref:HAD family phosphatase n=1 Tax=Paenibacillus terricola TaxID=2763503 RepID=A0ABR8MMP3_9BACL|nr:Cof-type HAD-IIB family hydrolase [Paenibacillus terricola]MBD3917282.1 HAD family phosphatase [Paenibacillus terricola]
MYKLIAIDIDDTLLNDELVVTEGTKQAMAAAIEQGVLVTLATGRMYASARKIANQIGLNVPIITYQGSLIKTLIDGEVLYERSVPTDDAKLLNEYCLKHGLHLQLYVDDVLYVREDNDKAKMYSNLSKIPYVVASDFDALLNEPQTKMLIIDDPDLLDRVAEELKPLIGERVHITKSKPHYLEFTHKEGTKGHALRFLAEHIGSTSEHAIAIGDAWNDREMIVEAGLGVAMGNALPALKEIANYVTLTNNEEGVRHVIEKFVLNAASASSPTVVHS